MAAAQNAVSKLTGKNINLSSPKISFSGSSVASMADGLKIANQLVGEVGNLAESVGTQAEKFPKIAEIFASQDRTIMDQMGEMMG